MSEKNETSAQRFINKVDVLRGAGHGVIFISTSEPDRAIQILNDATDAWETGNGLAVFKLTTGSYRYNFEDNEKPTQIIKTPFNSQTNVTQVLNCFQSRRPASEPRAKPDETDQYPFQDYNYLTIATADVLLDQQTNAQFALMQQHLLDLHAQLPYWEDGKLQLGKRVFCLLPSGYVLDERLSQIPLVSLDRPSVEEHEENLIATLQDGYTGVKPNYSSSDFREIAVNAAGLTDAQATAAFGGVIFANSIELENLSASEFGKLVGFEKTQMIEKSPVLSVMKSVPIEEVGGLEVLKEDAKIIKACMQPEARALGIDLPKGIFLVGGSGTGKSLFAKAISSVLKVPLIQFDLSRVFGSLVGSSEKNIKEALEIISSSGEVVVLVDEIDKVVSTSGSNDGGTSSRVLGTLLTFMQESNTGAYWVFTANRVENLPPEFLRRGRVDCLYSVNAPTAIEREAILRIHMQKRGVSYPESLAKSVVASKSFVSAELEASVIDAMRAKYVSHGNTNITDGDLVIAMSQIKPSAKVFAKEIAAMEQWAKDNARAASYPEPEVIIENKVKPAKRTRTNKIATKVV